jgi:hypothetical protein
MRFEDLHLGRALLAATGPDAVGLLTEAFVGEGVVLGAAVHGPRVLRSDRLVPTVRRATTGAPVHVSGGLYVGLVLPSIDWAYEDATARTVLNRNVRPLLAALRTSRVQASYLGRDFVSVVDERQTRRAALALGFDVLPDGRLLLEAIGSVCSDLAIPSGSASDLELGTRRFGGKETRRLEALGDPGELAESVARGLTSALDLAPAEVRLTELGAPEAERALAPLGRPLEVPIGWLEALQDPSGELVLGGDLLVARHALDQAASGSVPSEAPIDGASWADVGELLRRNHRSA